MEAEKGREPPALPSATKTKCPHCASYPVAVGLTTAILRRPLCE